MTDWLDWPFFEPRHRELSQRLEEWCRVTIHDAHAADPDAACRALVGELGKAGFLSLCVAQDGKGRPGDCQAAHVRRLAVLRYAKA